MNAEKREFVMPLPLRGGVPFLEWRQHQNDTFKVKMIDLSKIIMEEIDEYLLKTLRSKHYVARFYKKVTTHDKPLTYYQRVVHNKLVSYVGVWREGGREGE